MALESKKINTELVFTTMNTTQVVMQSSVY